MALPQWELIVRLLLAAGLGSIIGLERERLVWAAGLRTHMLVSVGSALVIIVSAYGFSRVLGEHVVLDPSRIAAQVVSGVGFLGAGSIILRNEVVKGLTTAASVWAVAGIGLAAGAGLYTAALASTLIILAILAGLKPLEDRYRAGRVGRELHLRVRKDQMSVGLLEMVLGARASQVKQLIVRASENGEEESVKLVLTRLGPKDAEEIIRRLSADASILEVREVTR